MSKEQSRFTPQNPQWYADLPERDAPDADRPAIFGDLNHVDETYLEISRASGAMRGMMLTLGVAVIVMGGLMVLSIQYSSGDLVVDTVLTVLDGLMSASLFAAGIYPLRLDLSTPRDEPIRFNRKRGKVYVTIFKHTWNPFDKWGAVAKEFDWNTIQAEVTKFAGFNGKTYMERYTFTLLSVKPGTNEVLERFLLASNTPVDNNFPALWAYIKTYMNGGPIVKPETPIRNQSELHEFRARMAAHLPDIPKPRPQRSSHQAQRWRGCVLVIFKPLSNPRVACAVRGSGGPLHRDARSPCGYLA